MNIAHIEKPSEKYSSLEQCSPDVSQLNITGDHPEILGDEFKGKRIGIIGTRRATKAGLFDTRAIAKVVAQNGFVVVSGMALGVDGTAHQGAIDMRGYTIGVLGCGVDVVYPLSHRRLGINIIKHGCLISEYDNGTAALAWHFPLRNRIIAALSDVLVVTEGTIRGGARITVDLALAMGKPICALPGPRRSSASELPNSLIRDGASAICDPSDVLAVAGAVIPETNWRDSVQLSGNHNNIIDLLSHESLRSIEIAHALQIDSTKVEQELNLLEQKGLIAFSRGAYQAI